MPWESESVSPEMRRRYQEQEANYRRTAQSVQATPSPRRTQPPNPDIKEKLREFKQRLAAGEFDDQSGDPHLFERYMEQQLRPTPRAEYSTKQHERIDQVAQDVQRLRDTLVAQAVDSGIEPEDTERIQEYVRDLVAVRGDEIEAEHPALAEAVRETLAYPAANAPEIATLVRRMAPDFADRVLGRALLRSEVATMLPDVEYARNDDPEEGARRTLKVGITHDVVDEVVTGKESPEQLRRLLNQVGFDDPSPMPRELSEKEKLALLPVEELHRRAFGGSGVERRDSDILVVTPSTADSPEPPAKPASTQSLADLDAQVRALGAKP